MDEINFTIDHIVLKDLQITPERVEHIRTLIEIELQRLLEREGLPDGLTAGEVSHLAAPPMHLSESRYDSVFANNLAQRIVHALRGIR